jgi:hypothetical protein
MPYEPCDDEVTDMISDVLKRYHRERLKVANVADAFIRVGAIFYLAKRNEKGELTGPPLRLHGYQCAATIKVQSLKNRAQGLPDATICIDGDWWKDAPQKTRIATIDHELEHLERVLDKTSAGVDDDLGRPRLTVRLHDWQLGGFRVIAERHREHALEMQMAQKFADEHGQLLFGFAGKKDAKGTKPVKGKELAVA